MPGIDETSTSFRFRVRDPEMFEQGSFRTIPFRTARPRIDAVVGRLRGEEAMSLQSLIFPKVEGWTREQVEAWVAAHRDELRARGVEAAMRLERPDEWVQATVVTDPAEAAMLARMVKRPLPGQVVRKVVTAKQVYPADFSADIVVSSDAIDRDQEVMDPAGMIVHDKVLPLVAGHFLGNLQNQIGVVSVPRPEGNKLVARAIWFAGRGNPQADWAWMLVQEGVARFSIGFIPVEYEEADISDEKVREQVRRGVAPVRRHTRWELVEVSQVIVPSNREAVQRMADAGILAPGEAVALKGLAREERMDPATSDLFASLLSRWSAKTVVSWAKDEDDEDILKWLGGPMGTKQEHRWTVGGARDLPLLDDDSWDADAAVAAWRRFTDSEREPSDRYRRGFVVYDAANPDNFGSYKLPFVKVVDGEARASRRGLIAARVTLAGGRGGVDIGDARDEAMRFVEGYLGTEEERSGRAREKAFAEMAEIRDALNALRMSAVTHEELHKALRDAVAVVAAELVREMDARLARARGDVNQWLT